jgi:hypothetical protein
MIREKMAINQLIAVFLSLWRYTVRHQGGLVGAGMPETIGGQWCN